MNTLELKHLEVKDVDGVAVVGFVDSGLMYATDLVLDVAAELKGLLRGREAPRFLIDFRNVQYLSSTMLAQLAYLERELKKTGGRLKICGLGPILRDTFRIGRFDSLFAIYDDEQEALKAYRATSR